MQEEQVKHEYDGIIELDNELPRWWLGIFWVTSLFGLFYVPYYHWFHPEKLPVASLQVALTTREEALEAAAPVVSEGVDSEVLLREKMAAGGWQESAQKDYNAFCFPCHAADGGGTIGPNFTDDYYMHGGTLSNIKQVITEGVPDKGMIAWKVSLKPEQIDNLTFFIQSLRGTTPAVAKEPQGDLVDELGNVIKKDVN